MSVLSIDKTILSSVTNINFLAVACFMFKNGKVKHKSTNYGTILHPEELYRDARTQTCNKEQSRKMWYVYKPERNGQSSGAGCGPVAHSSEHTNGVLLKERNILDLLATDPEVRVRFLALPDSLRSSGSETGVLSVS
jgi:hypothetical protein